MLKINIKKEFKNLDGEKIAFNLPGEKKRKFLTVGQALAEILLSNRNTVDGFRPLRKYELAKKFYGIDAKKDVVEIDKSELLQIKQLVESNNSFLLIVTAQLLEIIEEILSAE